MRRIQTCVLAIGMMAGLMIPAFAQPNRNQNYYRGMRSRVRRGDYDRYQRDYDRRFHRDDGGIGPGKGALIGGAGGAALGAVFGGGLKGALIGGVAGAGIGAIVGNATQDDHGHHRH